MIPNLLGVFVIIYSEFISKTRWKEERSSSISSSTKREQSRSLQLQIHRVSRHPMRRRWLTCLQGLLHSRHRGLRLRQGNIAFLEHAARRGGDRRRIGSDNSTFKRKENRPERVCVRALQHYRHGREEHLFGKILEAMV